MHKLKLRSVLLATSCAATLGVGVSLLLPRPALADNEIDCSDVNMWKSDNLYSGGEVVKWRVDSWPHYHEFKCKDSYCHGSAPSKDNRDWIDVGLCR